MTGIFFSPTTGTFHDAALGEVPEDGIAVTVARHAELVEARSSGAAIELKRGKPVAVLPPLTREAIVLAIKAEAGARIRAIAPLWRQINDLTEPDEGTPIRQAAIMAIRDASTMIEAQLAETADKALADFPVATNPLWPETA